MVENEIQQELLQILDEVLLSKETLIGDDVYHIYQKFVSMKQQAPDGMKIELFRAVRNFMKEKIAKNLYLDALFLSRFLIVKSQLLPESFFDIADCLFELDCRDLALDFLKLYEKKEDNKPLRFITLANFYNLKLKDYKLAIKYYEQYLKIDRTKSVIYTILGSLYAKAYGEISLKDQVYCYEKAYELKPDDRLIHKCLAFGYEKLKDLQKAKKFYQKLVENNPTETDLYNYGGFLISCGEFVEGHKYFTHRFLVDDVNLEYPVKFSPDKKWNLCSDISDKILMVHYEQGFGDSIMYCRFLPFLNNIAKKVIFVVQDELVDLIKSSVLISDSVEVVSSEEDVSNIEYDYHMALLDVPYVLKSSADNLPFENGYLEVLDKDLKKYQKKYIKSSNRLKVGISCSGNKGANYNGRDIDFVRFKKLLKLDADFYLLQKDVVDCDDISNLGGTFKTFTDTACAVQSMDIVISTDNVILNLAGALGVKTIGLFNNQTNFRWFKLNEENVGWYRSVKPLQAEIQDNWSDVLSQVMNILCDEIKV